MSSLPERGLETWPSRLPLAQTFSMFAWGFLSPGFCTGLPKESLLKCLPRECSAAFPSFSVNYKNIPNPFSYPLKPLKVIKTSRLIIILFFRNALLCRHKYYVLPMENDQGTWTCHVCSLLYLPWSIPPLWIQCHHLSKIPRSDIKEQRRLFLNEIESRQKVFTHQNKYLVFFKKKLLHLQSCIYINKNTVSTKKTTCFLQLYIIHVYYYNDDDDE